MLAFDKQLKWHLLLFTLLFTDKMVDVDIFSWWFYSYFISNCNKIMS